MHVFPASFFSHATGSSHDHKLTLIVDQANSELIHEVGFFPRGKPLLVMLYEIEEGQEKMMDSQKDADDMRKTMLARIHAKIGEIESTESVDFEVVKRVLKARMKAHYSINKDSFADYTEQELANAIYILDTELNPAKFDYSRYR